MASGRDYLQSILTTCARLHDKSDTQLESISDGLKRVDDDLGEAIDYLEE